MESHFSVWCVTGYIKARLGGKSAACQVSGTQACGTYGWSRLSEWVCQGWSGGASPSSGAGGETG